MNCNAILPHCKRYLTGNPCTGKDGYRDFVITTLPNLRILDGQEIEKSERILARQRYDEIRARFLNDREIKLSEEPKNEKEVANEPDEVE